MGPRCVREIVTPEQHTVASESGIRVARLFQVAEKESRDNEHNEGECDLGAD
jgi:hypothetical protein